MTPDEKQHRLTQWHRFQQRYERIYTVKFRKALHEQVMQWKLTNHITSTPIYTVLVSLYKTVGPLWAQYSKIHRRKREVKMRGQMGFNERIIELIKQHYGIDLLNDAEQITAYTREVIQRILIESAPLGLSVDEIVKRMLGDSELSAMRARRIARTETVGAANAASVLEAKESGVPMLKEWLAVHDNRTRKSHQHADGLVVALDYFFTLEGGVTMQQPGARVQKSGLPTPADDVVNCRCTLGFSVIKK